MSTASPQSGRTLGYREMATFAGWCDGMYSNVVLRASTAVAVVLAPRVGPAAVTLSGLAVGSAAGVGAMVAHEVRPTWPVGLAALLAWQLAYLLDSVDGQLARATGRSSAAGAALDILCDLAVQSLLVAAICAAIWHDHRVPVVLLALFASTWMVNLVTALIVRNADAEGHSLLRRKSRVVGLLKLSRDYGFVALLVGIGFVYRPLLLWVFAGTFAVNVTFLLASIAHEAGRSRRVPAADRPDAAPAAAPSGVAS